MLHTAHNILLSRPDRIGDVVVASSCLSVMREQLPPDARLFFLVRENCAELFANHPALAGVVAVRGSDNSETLAEKLRKLNIDTVVHLHPSAIVAEAANKANIERQFSNDFSGNKNPRDLRHEAERNFDILEKIGFQVPANNRFTASLAPDPRTKAVLIKCLPAIFTDAGTPETLLVKTPFVAFHCGAYGKKIRLPAEIFLHAAEVVRIRNSDTQIVVIGDPMPDENADRFIAEATRAGSRISDTRGKLSLSAGAWLLKYADACLSRDSGPAHIAAAMGCRTLTIFPENTPGLAGPARWLPLGETSHFIVTPAKPRWWEPWPLYRRRAARGIKAKDVSEKLIQLLNE